MPSSVNIARLSTAFSINFCRKRGVLDIDVCVILELTLLLLIIPSDPSIYHCQRMCMLSRKHVQR